MYAYFSFLFSIFLIKHIYHYIIYNCIFCSNQLESGNGWLIFSVSTKFILKGDNMVKKIASLFVMMSLVSHSAFAIASGSDNLPSTPASVEPSQSIASATQSASALQPATQSTPNAEIEVSSAQNSTPDGVATSSSTNESGCATGPGLRNVSSCPDHSDNSDDTGSDENNAVANTTSAASSGFGTGIEGASWVQTESGLQYRFVKKSDVVAGNPGPTDLVTVNYLGQSHDDNNQLKTFDSSYSRGKPSVIRLSAVIDGWREMLELMTPGDKVETVIPAKLAYGERGLPGIIKPNDDLNFTIELLDFKKSS